MGRLLDTLEDLGILDDTLMFAIIGDNGPSAEGTLQGTFDELLGPNGFSALETPEYLLSVLDDLGGPEGYNHYAVGWAHAMSTPYQWTKQVASHWGGTRNGTVVRWPNGFDDQGGLRHQFHHVIDVAPTILEAAGLPQPTFVHGVQQKPIEGVSMLYSLVDGSAADRRTTQYFEMMGNRGIYHKGWTAVTKHRTPWVFTAEETVPFDDDVWELYGETDWTQTRNLAAEMPGRLHELQRLWLIEATKHNVLPLDDRVLERFNADMAGRPQLVSGDSQLLFGGMGRLSENVVLNIKNKSHSVTAEVVIPEGGAQGVIVAQGGSSGGWSLYAHEGKLKYCYNLVRRKHFYVESAGALPEGTRQVRMEFNYDGGGLAKGGTVALFVDGDQRGEGRVEQTIPFVFSSTKASTLAGSSGRPFLPTTRWATTPSTVTSIGCRSTSVPTTTITSSHRRNDSTWPWCANRSLGEPPDRAKPGKVKQGDRRRRPSGSGVGGSKAHDSVRCPWRCRPTARVAMRSQLGGFTREDLADALVRDAEEAADVAYRQACGAQLLGGALLRVGCGVACLVGQPLGTLQCG